jgi:hypothetical protein
MTEARQTFDSVRELSERPGIEVIVSDNSGDPLKRAELEASSTAALRYVKSAAADVLGNWCNALRHAEGELACFLSDDDLLVALPGFETDDLVIPAGAAGLRPHMALYTEATGIYAHSGFEIAEVRAIDRVKAYFARNAGANTTLFSCFRRPLLQDMLFALDAHHPTRAGYTDWSMVLGLVSSGPLLPGRRLLYLYNNRNWATAEAIARNTTRTFVDANLPPAATQILNPLTALDSFATICRSTSPIAAEEKLEAAWYVVQTYFDGFVAQLQHPGFTDSIEPAQREFALALARDARSPVDKLAASLLIADAWLPGRRDAYEGYFAKTLDRDVMRSLYNGTPVPELRQAEGAVA